MAKIELKGTILEVGPVVQITEKMRKQIVVIEQKPYTDEYGDVKGKPEYWALDVINDNIEKLGFNASTVGLKGKFTVYLNGNRTEKEGKTFYIINAVLNATEFKA